MTRAAKQKAVRQATAAYTASQPLFDALRIGFVRVGEQKAHLSIARDIVQHLHVKLGPEDPNASKQERERHERYIDAAVKAWRSATEIYSEIFEAMANMTAAEVAEGKGERNGHKEFAKMAKTAKSASMAADAFMLYEDAMLYGDDMKVEDEDGAGGSAESEESEDEEDEDDGAASDVSSASSESGAEVKEGEEEEKESVDPTPTNPILLHLLGKRTLPEEPAEIKTDEPVQKVQRLSEKIKYDTQGRKILWDKGAEKPNVPYGTLGGSEKKAWKAEKRRQKREKRQAKRAGRVLEDAMERNKKGASGANGTKLGERKFQEDTSKPVFDRDFISLDGPARVQAEPVSAPAQNGVEYEDVSAEVEARLKAKEERKAREKEEKKRKRQSGESTEAGDVEVKVEKPKKKKVKAEAEAETEAAPKIQKEKREKHGRDGDDGGEGEGRKKRKKA